MSDATTPPLVAIVGPTGVGKSDLGIALARALDGEVVNADSMQLYRGMDIGTAKLPADQRREVPHHLLDVWDVRHTATVVEFRDLARATIDDVRSRGRRPLLVGGSGLYVHALLDDWDFPGTDPQLRASLEDELAAQGAQRLHDRLREVDPDAAARILPTNGRRIVRALEVVTLRGRFTATLPTPGAHDAPRDVVLVGLELPRPVLDERIARRVDAMWDAGFVDEVRALLAHGLREGRTASRALGYAQVLRMLDGQLGEQEAKDELVRATRRFARRQLSWFRRDPRVQWIPADDAALVQHVLALIVAGAPADRP